MSDHGRLFVIKIKSFTQLFFAAIIFVAVSQPVSACIGVLQRTNPPGDVEAREAEARRLLPTTFPGYISFMTWAIMPDSGSIGRYQLINPLLSAAWREGFFRSNQAGHSPLLIDFGNDGLQLSQKGIGAYFDVLDQGQAPYIQWVSQETNDGFLIRDINENGTVDDGSELFGQGTDMIIGKGKAEDGYQALQQFDTPQLGGNEDNKISKKDAVWSELRIWIDQNGDGVSVQGELFTLAEMKVKSFKLKRRYSSIADSAGNAIPYWSWVRTRVGSGPNRIKMFDVFFSVISE